MVSKLKYEAHVHQFANACHKWKLFCYMNYMESVIRSGILVRRIMYPCRQPVCVIYKFMFYHGRDISNWRSSIAVKNISNIRSCQGQCTPHARFPLTEGGGLISGSPLLGRTGGVVELVLGSVFIIELDTGLAGIYFHRYYTEYDVCHKQNT